jgi:hypothetical protein
MNLESLMKSRRARVVLGMLVGGVVVASCDPDTITAAVGGRQLAELLDSAFRADSAAGLRYAPKSIAEEEVAYLADRGLRPVSVSVTTDSGAVRMWMLAGAEVDTNAQGAIADSLSVVYGWTSDYQTWLIFVSEQFTGNGPAVSPGSQRVGPLALLTASRGARGNRAVHAEVDIDSLYGDWLGFVWHRGTTISEDSAAGVVSWYGAPGKCTWAGVPLARFDADSAAGCVPATYNVQLALRNGGPVSSLTRVIVPAQPIPAMRFVEVNF